MLIQFTGCWFHSCSPGFVVVNQVALQEPEAAQRAALWAVMLWWTTVVARGQGLGTAQAEYLKRFVVITGCLTCNLCLEGADRLFQCTGVLFSTRARRAFQRDWQELLQQAAQRWVSGRVGERGTSRSRMTSKEIPQFTSSPELWGSLGTKGLIKSERATLRATSWLHCCIHKISEISGITSWKKKGNASPALLRYGGDMSAVCLGNGTKGSLTQSFTSHS